MVNPGNSHFPGIKSELLTKRSFAAARTESAEGKFMAVYWAVANCCKCEAFVDYAAIKGKPGNPKSIDYQAIEHAYQPSTKQAKSTRLLRTLRGFRGHWCLATGAGKADAQFSIRGREDRRVASVRGDRGVAK